MDFKLMFIKGAKAIATWVVAYLTGNAASISADFLPDSIEKMTVGALVAAAIIMGANWLKNKAN